MPDVILASAPNSSRFVEAPGGCAPLDTDIGASFVRVAASIVGAPAGFAAIVECDGPREIARHGAGGSEAVPFAAWQREAPFVVPDVRDDERFGADPYVLGALAIRFCAGFPLRTRAGDDLGTLIVADRVSRELDGCQRRALEALAETIVATLEHHRRLPWQAVREPFLFEGNPNPMWIYDCETAAFLAVNDAAVRQYGYDRAEFLSMTLRDIRPREEIAALDDDLGRLAYALSHSKGWKHRATAA